MTKVSDVTLGQLAVGARRYWPFLTIVVAVLLVGTVLPAERGDERSDALAVDAGTVDGGASAGSLAVDGAVSGDAPMGTTAGGLVPSGGATSPASALATGGAPSGAPAATGAGPASSTAGVRWPGVGTEAALSAPDCDRATGRLKIPTPYSPPCVPVWPAGADNGGATWRGVTNKEIVVVVRRGKPSQEGDAASRAIGIYSDPEQFKKYLQGYIDIFNRYAETYGRKVRIV